MDNQKDYEKMEPHDKQEPLLQLAQKRNKTLNNSLRPETNFMKLEVVK